MSAAFEYEELGIDECWSLLAAPSIARLAVDIGGRPEIFPINIVVDHDTIVFRSGAGTKLVGAVLNRWVSIEIDGEQHGGRSVWSVVVKGEAREISNASERYEVQDLPLFPWVASPKPVFVRVFPTEVTGRRFRVVKHRRADRDPLEYHPGAPQMSPD